MDIEIEDKLQEIYTIEIKVEFKDFRQYKIKGLFGGQTFEFIYLYNVNSTFDSNINSIVQKIDLEIIKFFRKGVKNDKS